MNTQKIQTGAQSTKGFTLVELIVVITILVILGTIAFLNLGGMSASARDSQRTSDLNQISQQVLTLQAKSGMSYVNMVTVAQGSLSGVSLAGTGVASGSTLAGGNVNYTALGVDQNKFQDPSMKVPYKMGATTLAGTSYQLAATLEDNEKSALVMGTYSARPAATVTLTIANGATQGTIANTDIGKLRVNDTVTGGSPTINTIKSISGDGLTITLGTAATAANGTLALAAEVAGLIAQSGSTLTGVVNGGVGANLPY